MPAPPEAMLVCSVCRVPVAASAYDDHLRTAHGLYCYAGVHRSAEETLEAALPDLLTARPDRDAWQALLAIANDQHGTRADAALASLLGSALATLAESQREPVLKALAPLAAHRKLIAALAGTEAAMGRALALASIAHVPGSPETVRPLRLLLADRQLPAALQVQALSRVWPTVSEKEASDLISKLLAGLSKQRALAVLRALEKQTGSHPAIAEQLDEMQENAKLACPRCGVPLRRAAMEQHLWEEHRLLLDGLKTRDPWALVEEWLDAAKQSEDRELVNRCHVAVEKIDPEGGPARLARMVLSRGLHDPEARQLLLATAREQKAACCPACYALVPITAEVLPAFVNYRPGRLSSRGYEVRTDDRRMRTRLDVRSPTEPVYQGREPKRSWTARGLSALAATPLVLIALAFAIFWPVRWGLPVKAVSAFLVIAVLAWAGARLFGFLTRPATDRLLLYAWRFLVPRLFAKGYRADESAFAAGLARLHTSGAGLSGVNRDEVSRLILTLNDATTRGVAPPSHLAAIFRLWVEREVAEGRDPVPLVVNLLGRVFQGQLPFAFAQHLLEDWATSWWTPTNLARVRVLLCDRAFEENFEVQTLIEAGQTAPALGTVLGTDEPRSLAALRLLWSLRPSRPWDRLGEVRTAFELASDANLAEVLGQQSDLLLISRNADIEVMSERLVQPAPATIRLTTLGVWLQDVLFRIPPRVFEVHVRANGCQLILGEDVFRSPQDLEPLSRDLERWFRYAFHDFLPRVDPTLAWQSPDRAAILRAAGAIPCPECGRRLLARAGEVGIRVGEARG